MVTICAHILCSFLSVCVLRRQSWRCLREEKSPEGGKYSVPKYERGAWQKLMTAWMGKFSWGWILVKTTSRVSCFLGSRMFGWSSKADELVHWIFQYNFLKIFYSRKINRQKILLILGKIVAVVAESWSCVVVGAARLSEIEFCLFPVTEHKTGKFVYFVLVLFSSPCWRLHLWNEKSLGNFFSGLFKSR